MYNEKEGIRKHTLLDTLFRIYAAGREDREVIARWRWKLILETGNGR